jgi:dihydrofolate reductase
MRMKRVHGILAVADNGVIGQGAGMPWHHSGDFKKFRQRTMGHALLMGYPTFKGIAEQYTKPGQQVLPGRRIFVVGREPFEGMLNLDVNFENVTVIVTHGPQDDIKSCLVQLNEDQTLFIAVGGRIYQNYLPFAEKIYLTKIHVSPKIDENTVLLSPETTSLLGIHYWRSVYNEGEETSNGVQASFLTLEAML